MATESVARAYEKAPSAVDCWSAALAPSPMPTLARPAARAAWPIATASSPATARLPIATAHPPATASSPQATALEPAVPAGLPAVSVHSTVAAWAPEDTPRTSNPTTALATVVRVVRNTIWYGKVVVVRVDHVVVPIVTTKQ